MKELNELEQNNKVEYLDRSQFVAKAEEEDTQSNPHVDMLTNAAESLLKRVNQEKENAEQAKKEMEQAQEELEEVKKEYNELKENGLIEDDDKVDDEYNASEDAIDEDIFEDKDDVKLLEDDEYDASEDAVLDSAMQGLSEEDEKALDEEIKELLGEDEYDEDDTSEEEARNKLKAAIREKIKPASETIDISSFSIAKEPVSVNSTLDKSLEDEVVYPLYHSGRSTRMKRFFAADIENINPDTRSSGLNTLETMKKVYRTFYEHITDANKPSSFEKWLKCTSFMDIKNLYMAAYKGAFEGANYITYTCENEDCENVWLSDNIEIKDMMEFKDNETKERFYELLEKESSAMDKLYTTEIIPISETYAISFHDPSIYNVVFENASLPRKFTNKYADMLSILMYIDTIYKIDVKTKRLIPIALKEFPDSISNTTKVKIYTYSKVLKVLTSDQYQTLGKYMTKINTREDEVKYYRPEAVCPKCGKKIEKVETNPLQMVFQRHSLEAIMNS